MDHASQLDSIVKKAMEQNAKDFRDFYHHIQDKLDEEKAKVEETAELNHEATDEAFEKVYHDALAVDSSNARGGRVRKEDSALFAAGNDVIAASRKIVERFRVLEEELKSHVWEHPVRKWQKDKEDLVEIMALGREHGEMLVNNALAPMTSPDRLVNADATSHEKAASDLFQRSHKTPRGDLWGTVAAAQCKQLNELAESGP